MNLGDFKDEIKANIRRGESLDTNIPGFIRKAALWLERNKTLNYMRKFATVTVDPEADAPRIIELTDTRIKSIFFFRWVNSDGSYAYMTQKDPRDFPNLEVGTPAFYYPNGVTSMILSATPDEELNGEIWCARYSAWPTADEATHWLLDNAEDVLEARTMINVAKHTRDPVLTQHWTKIFDEALVGLYAAEEEFTWENSDIAMEYNPAY